MWERVMATCPDDHLQLHMVQPRQMVRDKGLKFNRFVWAGDYYGFFQDDEAVAVVKKQDDRLVVFIDPGSILD
jgi:hypothetical protein